MEKKEDKTLFIDSWIMSCRVLKRNMEAFTLDHIISIAKEQGINKIVGEYIPTAKNQLVKEHYSQLGFKANENLWELKVSDYQPKKAYIEKKL